MTKVVEGLKIGVNQEKETIRRKEYRREVRNVLERLCEEGYIRSWKEVEEKGHKKRCVTRRRVSVGPGSVSSRRERKRGSKGSRERYRKGKERWGRHGEKGQVRVSTGKGVRRNKGRRKNKSGGKRRLNLK